MNDDVLNKRRYEEYSLLYVTTNNSDLIINVGFEAYAILGGGFSATLNLSEAMRRAKNLFIGGCEGND